MAGNIISQNGQKLPFTCESRRFHTNTNKGEPHAPLSTEKGSVFNAPLYQDASLSLWLEHICDKAEPSRDGSIYWLMWYDAHGLPRTVISPVMERDDIATMAAKLASLLP